jgi:hypothetical protein
MNDAKRRAFSVNRSRLTFAGRMAVALAAGAAAFGVYSFTARPPLIGDTLPARYLPVSVLERGDLYVDDAPTLFSPLVPRGPDGVTPYPARRVGEHFVSWYPIGTALLAVPIYAGARLAGVDLHDEVQIARLERTAASLLVAASVSVLALALFELTDPRWTVALTLLYAVGTTSLSTSSQLLWQHTGGQLALCGAYYGLAASRWRPAWFLLAGFASGVAVLARPSNAILLAPVLLVVVFQEPAARVRVVLGVLPAILFELGYRLVVFHDPFYTQVGDIGGGAWTSHWLCPFAGLLLSPGRGLFVYTPAFVLSVVGFCSRSVPRWLRAIGVGSLLTVGAYAHWRVWWGGWSVGPRLLADLSPGLVLGLAPLRAAALRVGAVTLGALSIAAHALIAFSVSAYAWNAWVGADVSTRVWQWHRSPISCAAREVFAGFANAKQRCAPRTTVTSPVGRGGMAATTQAAVDRRSEHR